MPGRCREDTDRDAENELESDDRCRAGEHPLPLQPRLPQRRDSLGRACRPARGTEAIVRQELPAALRADLSNRVHGANPRMIARSAATTAGLSLSCGFAGISGLFPTAA